MNLSIRIFTIFVFFLCLQCKKDIFNWKSKSTDSATTKASSNLSDQCPVSTGAKLSLAEEAFAAPTISKLDISSDFPAKLTYSSDQVFDHAEISICANDNTCENTYSYTDSKLIAPSKLGVIVVKVRLCFNTACSAEKTTQFMNKTVLDADKKAVVDRLAVLDTKLLSLAEQRLKLEGGSPLTPYVFLRTFEELYLNQPQRLELANEECGGTLAPMASVGQGEAVKFASVETVKSLPAGSSYMSDVPSNSSSDTMTEAATGTSTATQTNTALSTFKMISGYLGIASSVLSFVMLGRDVYKTYTLNQEMIRKTEMFQKIGEVIEDPKIMEELKYGNYEPLRKNLEQIRDNPKYTKYFSKDKASSELMKEVEDIDDKIKELERIDKDKSIPSDEVLKKVKSINADIEGRHNILETKLVQTKDRDLEIPKEAKKPIKGYAGGIGKFLAGIAVSSGFLAFGYSLSDETGQTIKGIDSEIYIALNERKYLLKLL